MRKIYLLTWGLFPFLIPVLAQAQYAVSDSLLQSMVQSMHNDSVSQMATSIQTLNSQLTQAQQMVSQLNNLTQYSGNPASIIPNLGSLPTSLSQTGVGKTLSTLSQAASGTQALGSNPVAGLQGLFPAIPNMTDSGNTSLTRDPTLYTRYGAIDQNAQNLQSVYSDSNSRIQQLRTDIQTTMTAIQNATTQAQVQKLQGQLQAQQNELNTLQGNKVDAYTQLQAQHVINQEQKDKEDTAATESLVQEQNAAWTNTVNNCETSKQNKAVLQDW